MKLRQICGHLLLLTTSAFAFASGLSLADQSDSGSQTTVEEHYSLTNGPKAEDKSPDISTYMEDIERVRHQQKSQAAKPNGGNTDPFDGGGPMGEFEAGGAGPSGPRALPPGDAPGYKGDLGAASTRLWPEKR